jgi:hypothetical protein
MEQLVDITKLTAAELKEYTKKAEAKENDKLEKERIAYETNRDNIISKITETANALSRELSEFKTFCHIEMEKQELKLTEYGKLRANSKGGFSITSSCGNMRVTRRRDTEPAWDERASKAIGLIKDFLADTVKKRDVKLYEILLSFLERNSKGDLEYSRVMDLYKHENKFDDDRWLEGLRLIKQSFTNHLKGYGYEFKIKNEETGKLESILLNFSSH